MIECAKTIAIRNRLRNDCTIKVITFYNKQRSELERLLKDAQATSDYLNNMNVCSIDGCQVR